MLCLVIHFRFWLEPSSDCYVIYMHWPCLSLCFGILRGQAFWTPQRGAGPWGWHGLLSQTPVSAQLCPGWLVWACFLSEGDENSPGGYQVCPVCGCGAGQRCRLWGCHPGTITSQWARSRDTRHTLSLKPMVSVFKEEGGQAQQSPQGTVCDLLAGSLECLAQSSKIHTDFNSPLGQVSCFGKL